MTDFQKRAGIQNSRLFQANTMSSMAVAKAGYHGLMRGKAVVVPGLKNKLLAAAVRLAPRSVVTSVAKKLNGTR
jgi:short-subunit dehydrogenase